MSYLDNSPWSPEWTVKAEDAANRRQRDASTQSYVRALIDILITAVCYLQISWELRRRRSMSYEVSPSLRFQAITIALCMGRPSWNSRGSTRLIEKFMHCRYHGNSVRLPYGWCPEERGARAARNTHPVLYRSNWNFDGRQTRLILLPKYLSLSTPRVIYHWYRTIDSVSNIASRVLDVW